MVLTSKGGLCDLYKYLSRIIAALLLIRKTELVSK